MDYGISALSLIPVRREPSEKSEMVTQVIFGEYFQILEEMVGWSFVQLDWDGYKGWMDSKMITSVNAETFQLPETSPHAVTGDIISLVPVNDKQNMILVAGSSLPFWKPNQKEFSLINETFEFTGDVFYGKSTKPRQTVIGQALKYVNAPYFWGGRSPLGIDCSGFTQILYKMIGVRLPRDASQQVMLGDPFSFVDEALPGDLAFFDNEEGRIVHVGILWERNKIIHASGKVRIDNVDQFGIFNVDLKRYTHKLRVMKKMIETNETD